jgi:hypothetical protein
MTNGIGRKESLFSMFSKIRLCGDMKIFFIFQVNGIVGFGGLNSFCSSL